MGANKAIFKEGKLAYFAGVPKRDNPYEIGTEDHVAWIKGYRAGEKEDIEQDPDGN
jgi:hypothetical protein